MTESSYCLVCGYNKAIHDSEYVQWVTDGCAGKWEQEEEEGQS